MMADNPQFKFVSPGTEQVSDMFQKFNRQPNWVMKTAVLAFLLIVGLPILALLLVAAVVATVVFAVLTGINLLLGRTRVGPSPDSGRQNVRVINKE